MTQKIIGLIGIFIFLFVAWLFSSHKKSINFKTILIAFFLEFIVGTTLFLLPKSRDVLLAFSHI